MMTQEEYMDVMAMKRQGLTINEIATETGYHPKTISSWLTNGGPPEKRKKTEPMVVDDRWAARIAELLRLAPRLLGTSVFEMIVAEGYSGSYASVTRHLHNHPRPEVQRGSTGVDPDRDRTWGGVPVRLVGLL